MRTNPQQAHVYLSRSMTSRLVSIHALPRVRGVVPAFGSSTLSLFVLLACNLGFSIVIAISVYLSAGCLLRRHPRLRWRLRWRLQQLCPVLPASCSQYERGIETHSMMHRDFSGISGYRRIKQKSHRASAEWLIFKVGYSSQLNHRASLHARRLAM